MGSAHLHSERAPGGFRPAANRQEIRQYHPLYLDRSRRHDGAATSYPTGNGRGASEPTIDPVQGLSPAPAMTTGEGIDVKVIGRTLRGIGAGSEIQRRLHRLLL